MLTDCLSCGGTVAPDGFCWDCGAEQPDFRAHLEITLTSPTTPSDPPTTERPTASGRRMADQHTAHPPVPGQSTANCGPGHMLGAGVSDRGKRRGRNADAMALATARTWTIGVVCDGISMSPRPERAAQVAAETGTSALASALRADVLPEDALTQSAIRAARAVAALATSVRAAPACTYVAAIAGQDGIWACWIGDSRAYWLPDEGTAMALTEDDTGAHDALSAWLGADAQAPEPRIRSYRPRGPGRLLLCTDGLWRHLPPAPALRPGHGDLLQDARNLVGTALDAGGHDNITALLIQVQGIEPGNDQTKSRHGFR
ncbi:PP2C family protein-serine/threonine phosphatase [Nonomuraea purpurea]|uniref:PP2C family protein-serine/threonine phosphatase n=1 Tax=Nonomuraea purpurea TaxID=1849276 RepID=A0ABV8GM04_9ACTN